MRSNQVKCDLEMLYDKRADDYTKDYKALAGKYFMQRKIETALLLADFKPGDNLLEVGCADGVYTFELAKLGFNMVGIDLSSNCISKAKKRAKGENIKNINFLTEDAENLSVFENNKFDGVISFSTLRYMDNPQLAINEMFRVVKQGKNVVCDFPNKLSPWFNYLGPWIRGFKHIHDHQYYTKDIKFFLKNAGFKGIKIKRILYTPKFITSSFLLNIMKVIDIVGELPFLDNFAGIIICSGKKL